MSSDETMQAPIKSVYRSATISLRKADIARENGDDPEQLAHLRAFVRTVRQSLHSHPLYDRRKTDPECVALDAKVPEVMQRIKTLNGSVSPPAEPADVVQAAASRLERGGGGRLAPPADPPSSSDEAAPTPAQTPAPTPAPRARNTPPPRRRSPRRIPPRRLPRPPPPPPPRPVRRKMRRRLRARKSTGRASRPRRRV